ncbi:PHD finger protein 7-like [Excalfactoria chinensis]|uniref:PHD finger protein 7-like n=1 Tax=Excalfactoria chinensis TaxID=46218 RepID=UPI003B3AAB46
MPIMSKGTKKAPRSGEQVCMLCRQAQVDPDICGQTFVSGGLRAHHFCLFFANDLLEWRSPAGGIFGFPLNAVRRTVQKADKKCCFVCRGRGATISCAEAGCKRSFHLPCAEDGECITQYFGQHKSFCWEHCPQQADEAAPSQNTVCVICLEPVGERTSYHTMVCPVCKQAWFHRGCIRKQAMHAGTMLFVCPVCRAKGRFRSKMATLGIQIPVRRPSWWDDEAYQSLRERHRRCDVSECFYPGGREEAENDGPWQLLLCSSCATKGTHWCCSFWSIDDNTWECDSCAAVDAASHSDTELSSPSTSSLVVPETTSAAAPRRHPRQRGTGRTRSRSPLRGRASGSQSQPRRRRGSSRTTARGAQSSTRTSATPAPSRSSRASPLPARSRQSRQRRRANTRSRSPVGRRASNSRSRPRGGQGSRSRQRGPARARSRSRAQQQRRRRHSQSQRRRRSSRVPSSRDGCGAKRRRK